MTFYPRCAGPAYFCLSDQGGQGSCNAHSTVGEDGGNTCDSSDDKAGGEDCGGALDHDGAGGLGCAGVGVCLGEHMNGCGRNHCEGQEGKEVENECLHVKILSIWL